ncbi:Alpha/Beta hydrolase protein [Haematococcus lacustris]
MCQGILFVELLHASGLRAADFTGASDPYAVLSVGPSMARSRVVFQSLNPAWHQRFFLYVKDLQADTLKVRLYDKDLFSSDDDLGTCLLPLSSLVPDQVTEMSLPLKGPGGQGSVHLRLRLARFSDHLLTRLTSHGASIPIDGGPGPAALQALEQGMAAMAALGQFRDQVVKKVDELRGAASANDVALSPWQVLADMAGWQSSSSWAPVAFIANEATDTQVWLYRNVLTREVVVGFRGTEQVKWKDFLTDLHLVPASLDPERVDSAGAGGLPGPMRILQAVLPSDQVQVHQGFLSAYDSVRPQLFHLLDCITRSPPTPSSPAPPPTPPTPAAPGALDPSSSASTSSGEGREAVLRRISQMLSQWSGGAGGSSSLGGSQQQGGGGSQAETSSAGTSSSSSSSSNRGEEDPGRPWRVYITGHSLGGALATLCAYELAARQSPERARQAITMYSFGAPRAGNKAFAARYNTLVPDSWRVTNSNDIIPSVPRLLGYAHVKHSVRIVNGELHIQADGTTDVFGEGRGGLDVLQELAGRATEQVTSVRIAGCTGVYRLEDGGPLQGSAK